MRQRQLFRDAFFSVECVLLIAILMLPVGLAAAQSLGAAYTTEAIYDVSVAENVMVPMRDGVRLATDIYRPARNGEAVSGTFPALLSRTPYGKGDSEPARSLAKHGYVMAVQDVRGRFDSEGTFYIYVNEGEDGYDAVEWIAEQPWSKGQVATYGGPTSPRHRMCWRWRIPRIWRRCSFGSVPQTISRTAAGPVGRLPCSTTWTTR